MNRIIAMLFVAAVVISALHAKAQLAALRATRPTTPAATRPSTAPKANPKIRVHRFTVHPATLPTPLLKYSFVALAIDRTHGNAATLYLMAEKMTPRDSAPLQAENVDGMTAATQSVLSPPASRRHINSMPGAATQSAETLADDYLNMSAQNLLDSDAAEFLKRVAPTLQLLDLAARREECRWDYPNPGAQPDTLLETEMAQLSSMRYLICLLDVRLRYEIAEHRYDDAVNTFRSGFAMAENLSQQANLVQAFVSAGTAELMLRQVEEFEQAPNSPNLYWALASLPRPFVNLRAVLQNEMSFSNGALMHSDQSRLASAQFKGAWDRIYSAFLLPYPQAFALLEHFQKTGNDPLGQLLIPPALRGGMTIAAIDRYIALYESIEAVRAYAAGHHGQPPATLADVVETPVPLDPITNEAFVYTVTGQTFTLEAPAPPSNGRFGVRMEATITPN